MPCPEIALPELYRELERRTAFTPESERGSRPPSREVELSLLKGYSAEFLLITDFAAGSVRSIICKGRVPQGTILSGARVITTGALREHRYEMLCAQANESGLGEDVKFTRSSCALLSAARRFGLGC
jgi:aspartyl-tRNA synthetase